jgi:hypothetical protein
METAITTQIPVSFTEGAIVEIKRLMAEPNFDKYTTFKGRSQRWRM